MTPEEALALIGENGHVRVVTKAGIEYDVAREVIDCNAETGYVYGSRVKHGGSFYTRYVPAGTTRWFYLKNVKPAAKEAT